MFVTIEKSKKYQFKPYEACPCGSQEKYKFCCYAKSNKIQSTSQKINAARLTAEGQKSFRDTEFKMCFGFESSECSKTLIGAHSIQNNGVLNQIAVENHVYALTIEIDKNMRLPQLKFESIGKNKASIFSGFCKKHDEEYFNGIEDQDYEASLQQNYWFAFRSLCFELHRKLRLKKSYSTLFQKYPQATRIPSIYTNYYTTGLNIRDSWKEYDRFKKLFSDNSYCQLDSFVKIIPFKVGFTATTSVAVATDMEGNLAADIYNYDEKIFIPSLYISVIPQNNSTIIIITRFKEDLCYEKTLTQLKNTENTDILFKYITFCLAEYSENVYFSPLIIDSLDADKRNKIKSAFLGTISPTPELRLYSMLQTSSLNLFDLRL